MLPFAGCGFQPYLPALHAFGKGVITVVGSRKHAPSNDSVDRRDQQQRRIVGALLGKLIRKSITGLAILRYRSHGAIQQFNHII